MPNVPILSLLILLVWGLLTVLIALTALIAQFYQRLSGRRTYVRLFGVPVVLFGVAAVRSSQLNQLGGDFLAEGAALIAALVLIGLCANLYRRMTQRG
jgi:hypothetical protein